MADKKLKSAVDHIVKCLMEIKKDRTDVIGMYIAIDDDGHPYPQIEFEGQDEMEDSDGWLDGFNLTRFDECSRYVLLGSKDYEIRVSYKGEIS